MASASASPLGVLPMGGLRGPFDGRTDGLQGYQPTHPMGVSGWSQADASTNEAIKAIISPSYSTFENVKRSPAFGLLAAGNINAFTQTVPETAIYVQDEMSPGLAELISSFQLVPIEHTQGTIRRNITIFNSSKWNSIGDFMTATKDMFTSFQTEASVALVGKMQEIDVKLLVSKDGTGRRLWYQQLNQAARGLMNTIVHHCVNALLDCSPDRLAMNARSNNVAPLTVKMPFLAALHTYIAQFAVFGKSPNGVADYADIIRRVANSRPNVGTYDIMWCDAGTLNRITKANQGFVLNQLFSKITDVPSGSSTRSYVSKMAEMKRIVELGPVSVSPNIPKIPPFYRRVTVATHCIIPGNATDIQVFDRRLDRFVPLMDAKSAIIEARRNSGAQANPVYAGPGKIIVFTVYQVGTHSVANVDSAAPQKPQLFLSKITDGVSLDPSQMRLGYYAVASIAAAVPVKTAVFFASDVMLEDVYNGGGTGSLLAANGQATWDLNTPRTRVAYRVDDSDVLGLAGRTDILSLYGSFPAGMTGTQDIPTWTAGGANPEGAMKTHFPNPVSLTPSASPLSSINGQTCYPYLSTQDACMYRLNNKDHVIQPKGIFGNHAYEGCTADICGAVGSAGYLRPLPSTILSIQNP